MYSQKIYLWWDHKFHLRNLSLENYIANLDKLKKKILIIDQDEIGEEINEILLICQVPMVDDCEKNIRITKKLKIEESLSFYNLKTYLLKK